MKTAVAVAMSNSLIPPHVTAGLAALVEEVMDQGERLASVERAVFNKARE